MQTKFTDILLRLNKLRMLDPSNEKLKLYINRVALNIEKKFTLKNDNL